MMTLDLTGKIAVVTGAGRGIGRAIASAFTASGADVACVGRTPSTLSDMPHPFVCDVSKPEEVTVTTQRIVDTFGTIDILVNNAGIKSLDRLTLQVSTIDWDQVLQTNLGGYFHWIKATMKFIIRRPHGRIINVSSILGITGHGGQVAYASSKAAIIGLTKSVAQEIASRGTITCNAIAPGFIDTDMNQDLSDELREDIRRRIPLRRFAQPEEVANLACFLASKESGYITGQTFVIDGGLTMN